MIGDPATRIVNFSMRRHSMSSSLELSLPRDFPYLGHPDQRYRLTGASDDSLTIERMKGQTVHVRTYVVFRCRDALLAAPERMLPLQDIPAGSKGQSIIGAILVAAELAEVVGKKPIQLRGMRR